MKKLMIDPEFVLDVGSLYRRADLRDAVKALRARSKACNLKMKTLRAELVEAPKLDPVKLEEFQKLNDQLRGIEIWRANMKYHLNML